MAKSSFLPRRNKGYFGQKVTKTLFGNSPIIRTYAFLPFLSFPSPIRSRASYGGNPVFGRFLTPWIPVPRLREDKIHGNDTDCVSPNNFVLTLSACHQENRYDRTYFLHA